MFFPVKVDWFYPASMFMLKGSKGPPRPVQPLTVENFRSCSRSSSSSTGALDCLVTTM